MKPMKSDSRVPKIRRDKMSLPTGSVPRRNLVDPPSDHAGGVKKESRYCSLGGCGATTSAKTASRRSATTNASPIMAPRLRENDCQNSRHGPGGETGSWIGNACAASGMPDPRIDHAIEKIDDQVDRNHDRGNQQDASLYDGIVAGLHTMDQPVADTRPAENCLGENGAGQEQADLQPDDSDHRDE